jgi:SAM-dependent methyltransferase
VEITYQRQALELEFSESWRTEHERRKRRHPLLVAISGWTRKLKPEIGERLLAKTLRWRKSGTLLDCGCGDGKFLAEAQRFFEVWGVEISARAAALAQGRVPAGKIICAPITEAALPASYFGVVTLFSVLEHDWHPHSALRAAHAALKPGGIAVIKVPNHASWNRHIMAQDWCGYRLPDHCNYFTPRSLADMLRRAGLRPLRGSFLDRMPTSDSLWMAAEKPR